MSTFLILKIPNFTQFKYCVVVSGLLCLQNLYLLSTGSFVYICFFEVISWIYVSICYAVFLQQFWINFIVWETCFCSVLVEKCGKYTNFLMVTSYWYEITSTSAKLGWPFIKCIHVYSFIEILLAFKVFYETPIFS